MSQLTLDFKPASTYTFDFKFDGSQVNLVYHPDWMGVDMVDLFELRGPWGYRSWFTWIDHSHEKDRVLSAAHGFLNENKRMLRKLAKDRT